MDLAKVKAKVKVTAAARVSEAHPTMPGKVPPSPPSGSGRPPGDEVKQGASSNPEPSSDQSRTGRVAASGSPSSSSTASGRVADYFSGQTGAVSTPAGSSKSSSKSSDKSRQKQDRSDTKERVIRALWPTPELKKDVRDATGADPNPDRLLSSARFRDMWLDFDSSKNPSAKSVTAMRKLAVEILGRKKGHTRRSQNQPKSESEGVRKSTKGAKRKTRSVSTERGASRSGHTPEAKSAKVTPHTSTSSSTIMEQGEDSDVIVDEDHEPSLDDFAEEMKAALPTYAQSAKGEKKKDYKYILYVHLGDEERRTMAKEVWTLLFEKVQASCLERVFAQKEVPKIEWSGYSKGVGVIAPSDEASRDIMKEIISNTKVAEHSFRAWAKGEKGKYTLLSILIPHTMKKEVFTAGKIMQAAIMMNQLPEGSHYIRNCKEVAGGGKQRILRLGAEDNLVQAFKDKNGVIYVAASKLEVYFQGARLTSNTST